MRDHTTDRERFYITATYEGLATGNLEKARQNNEAWAQTYPREALPHTMLSGYPNKAAGRYERAIAEARKAIELDPDFAIAYYNLGVNHVYLIASTRLRMPYGALPDEGWRSTNSSCWSMTSPS